MDVRTQPSIGQFQHPPLMGWVAARMDVRVSAHQLVVSVDGAHQFALALWAVDLIARRFGGRRQANAGAAAFDAAAIYQFHAQRFQCQMRCCWRPAIATIASALVRNPARSGGPSPRVLWAPLAMLGKYYSVFLLASFALRDLSPATARLLDLMGALGFDSADYRHWCRTCMAADVRARRHSLMHWRGITRQGLAPSVIEGGLCHPRPRFGAGATDGDMGADAKERLKQIPLDFWAMNCGLCCCFWSASARSCFR